MVRIRPSFGGLTFLLAIILMVSGGTEGNAQAPYPVAGGAPYSETVTIHSGMFSGIMPPIPNLELGYVYSFGSNVRMGRAVADYVLPINIGAGSVVFGEAHGEYSDFWKSPSLTIAPTPGAATTTTGSLNRIDLSFGGGYRGIFGNTMVLGASGFYDTSRICGKWYGAGGFGVELAAITGTSGAVDLSFNWYGNLFSRGGFINAFRNTNSSFDVEAGFSQGLFNNALDLRLKAVGYKFAVGDNIWGWKAGTDLTTRDGMLCLRYEYGHDRLNDSYNSISAHLNVGFQLENVFSGTSPIASPAPVFVNPRNLSRLFTQKVKRNWHQPSQVVLANQSANPASGAVDGGYNTTRFLATVSEQGLFFAGMYSTIPLGQFAPVPFTCLSPGGRIVVTFAYTFDVAPPSIASFSPAVYNAGFVYNEGALTLLPPIPASGTLTIPLDFLGVPAPLQDAFINSASDPTQIDFPVFAPGTNTLTITNVTILFNQ